MSVKSTGVKSKQLATAAKTPLRFHVVGLPHTQTTLDYEVCAYTAKVRKFCNMMKSLGHDVFLYASEENEAACDELITIASKQDQRRWFGDYDFRNNFFNITWNAGDAHWRETNNNAIKEIKQRVKSRDFICIIGGICQKPIADAFPDIMSVEYGIGYSGIFAKYKVFESYAWMHYLYGVSRNDNGQFYDAVIPNYFEPEHFKLREKKDDYYLFLGRLIPRKGPEIAVEATRRIGARLIMAGQGVKGKRGNTILGEGIELTGDHIEHVGHADVQKRKELLAGAKAVFMGTTYLEPFGGVSIESLLSGTPVIATDFGVFPENIRHGEHGYRIRTIGEAVWAAQNVDGLNNKKMRDYAVKNFSVDRVRFQYQAYFEQLLTLHENGFYSDWDHGVSVYERYSRR